MTHPHHSTMRRWARLFMAGQSVAEIAATAGVGVADVEQAVRRYRHSVTADKRAPRSRLKRRREREARP